MKFLKKAIKHLGMAFLVDPPISSHEQYLGIQSHPGFHTTESLEIAAHYAIGRVNQNFTDEEEGGHYTTDYPVVVSLDMSGLSKHLDWDAEIFVQETLQIHLDELIKQLPENPTDDDIYDKTQELIDIAERQSEVSDGPLAYLAEETFYHMQEPLPSIMDLPEYPAFIRDYIKTKHIPDDILMTATDQYRYIEDVPEERLVAVWFITPVANEEFRWDEESEEDFEKRWPGFEAVDADAMYGGYWNPTQQLIWGEEKEGVEYHGTTYHRLLQAAPFLEGVIPEPPTPPYYKED